MSENELKMSLLEEEQPELRVGRQEIEYLAPRCGDRDEPLDFDPVTLF